MRFSDRPAVIAKVLCVFVASAALSPAAAGLTLKVATLAPAGSVWMQEMQAAAEAVATHSEGRVALRFYPGGVMGDTPTLLRKMQLGQLHGAAASLGELASTVGDGELYSMPFLFRDQAEFEALRPDLDQRIAAAFAAKGLLLAGTTNSGIVYLYSRHRAASADELAATARVWAPQGDIITIDTLAKAGIKAVPLPIAEVYTGLQTGLVDTVVNTMSGLIALQWHSRVRYMIDLPIALSVSGVIFQERALAPLAAADRERLVAETAAALRRLDRRVAAENADARSALRHSGIEIIQPDSGSRGAWEKMAREVRHALLAAGKIDQPSLRWVEERLSARRAAANE